MRFRVTLKPYNEKKSVAAILYGLRRVCAGLITVGALLLLLQQLGVSCRRATMTIYGDVQQVYIRRYIGAIFLREYIFRCLFITHILLPTVIAQPIIYACLYNIILGTYISCTIFADEHLMHNIRIANIGIRWSS